ncbi:MAG: major facilitator superfamily 1 [Nitrososphaera sp.]|nr:major facilitator superfamily 1 [Nitrososphaera sp.]
MNPAVVLVAICSAIVGVSYGMHSPVVPVFAREQLAADYSQVGLIGTANFLPFMFAPFFIGILLDRLNKSYVLLSGILLNVFSIFILSTVQSTLEVTFYRALAGVAHALFWPSCEVLISINSPPERRVRNISVFIAAWILGFMVGPLIGKLILNAFDYYTLFQLAAATMAVGIVPSVLLRSYGWPAVQKDLEVRASSVEVAKEIATHPKLAGVILYYAITFGVVLAVYPAYMSDASLTTEDIEIMFFFFGVSRFATLLLLVTRISRYGELALALAVSTTAVGMIISFSSTSVLSFAVSIALFGLSTSIFYPVTFGLVTMDTPSGHVGSKLGVYNTLFGAGWTAGPIMAGFASDAFGPGSPYLAFFVIGSTFAAAITIFRKGRNHF